MSDGQFADAIGAGLPHFSEGYFLLAGEFGHGP
jgi:hypothetical protein